MKIAIMTQPLGRNYGGILQNFALQKVLKDMGHEAVTLDYHFRQRNFFYRKSRLALRLAKKVTGKRKAPVNLEKYISFITEYNQKFIDTYIIQSKPMHNTGDLKKNFKRNKYDAVIVGSDQTWRPQYSPNIYDYYLEFLGNNKKIKRIAYASSFGVDDWEYSAKQTKKCAKLASLFDGVSVREQSGVELCREQLGIDSQCTLDPTLLLEKEDYLELIGSRYNKGESKGVFTYFLDSNQGKISAAKYIANSLKTYTYKCQAKKKLGDPSSNNLKDYQMPAIQDWLASFANAEFVLTDSFHGMVLSIIFEKPFLVIVNKERGAARFESLLNKIGSLDYLVNDLSDIKNGSIDIKSIKPLNKVKLNKIKDDSLSFLATHLVGNK